MANTAHATSPDAADHPSVMPIRDVISYLRLRGVHVRQILRLIGGGKLAGAKVGREWLVDPEEVRHLYAPKLRPKVATTTPRESETRRIHRQLAKAGIAR